MALPKSEVWVGATVTLQAKTISMKRPSASSTAKLKRPSGNPRRVRKTVEKSSPAKQRKKTVVTDEDGGSFDGANPCLFPASKTLPEFGVSDGKTRCGLPLLLPYKLKLPKCKPLELVVVRPSF